MSKQIIYVAIIILTCTATTTAHEPIGLRLIREYHQQNARIAAEAERQRQRFAQWEREWQRQAQARQAALTPKRVR
ncbi:MAG: hypothetical protein DMF64_16675 [Acidobacteria bacterium]|nr:MAG: hypothetical protein DMF64_16675 [Acidobacteriota bacterium]